ncbi:MAG: protein-L-isoaspartate(D-aspartate) O-methyltransferase [Leptospirales bacterium]|nr:protein-L-isoaspartate(D-aspartate) O-methyltransferase [Leptospirales bacterium]
MFRSNDGMEYARRDMTQSLVAKGISGVVLDAVYRTPRHLFVSDALRYSAYKETSLPIGFGQTISKPSVIAAMVQALSLTGDEHVLEIGTGSGYQTAVLSQLAGHVVTMERIEVLAMRASKLFESFDVSNITFLHTGDFNDAEGTFDAILVAAGVDILPVDLCDKLNAGGRLVVPLGDNSGHRIMKYIKKADGSLLEDNIGSAVFVPYIAGSC